MHGAEVEEGTLPVRYAFVGIVCASHTSNLCVQTAVVGGVIQNPVEADDIVLSGAWVGAAAY
jgi:hypothetical protein